MENLYEILEVSKNASNEVIEKAYKTLVKKYHPDLQEEKNKSFAEEKIKKINYAYDILSNEIKRADYDKKLNDYEKSVNNVNKEYNSYNENKNKQKTEEDNWKEKFSKLSYKEQKRIIKDIEKKANEEYSKIYVDYLRSLGFKIKHKWTLKDILIVIIAILCFILICVLLWIIPFTKNILLDIYNSNEIIKLIVDVIVGTFKSAVKI